MKAEQSKQDDSLKSTGHTPGPWKISNGRDEYQILGRTDDPEFPIARALVRYWPENDTDRSNETDRANARLIAAAPDLLAACKSALETSLRCDEAMGVPRDENKGTHTMILEAAIAKAVKP